MAKINIIGLGFGDSKSITVYGFNKIKENLNYLRTRKSPVINILESEEIDYFTYDNIYDEVNDFDDLYKYIAKDLVNQARKYDSINYCVPGSPILSDKVTDILIEKAKDEEVEIEIVNGVGIIDSIFKSVGITMNNNTKILDGLEIKSTDLDINSDLIITQVYDKIISSELKIILQEIYEDDYEVYIINGSKKNKSDKIPLYEIDRITDYNHMTFIFIPCIKEKQRKIYDMNNLITIMEILRSKEGCLWDLKQDHKSLRQYILEEAYEVVDAIDNDDIELLEEELGDLLLQVIFHSQIAREEGYFNIWDVTSSISKKLIYRHPHVFEEASANNVNEANTRWNEMKNKKKGFQTYIEDIKDIPKGLSALMKAFKIQKKASKVGFDWEETRSAYEKVEEEILELKEAIDSESFDDIEEEFGDVLFALVNYARFLGVNPELALNRTIRKFIYRFEFIENKSIEMKKDLKNMTLEEMDGLWDLAKTHKNPKK